jgi:CRISPR/Cas system Type II protein with McrA/HNH and RuvC-like nuclease domain
MDGLVDGDHTFPASFVCEFSFLFLLLLKVEENDQVENSTPLHVVGNTVASAANSNRVSKAKNPLDDDAVGALPLDFLRMLLFQY